MTFCGRQNAHDEEIVMGVGVEGAKRPLRSFPDYKAPIS